jgi:3'-5' exoribonuclease
VNGLYLAKEKRLGTTKRGDPFLSVTLADRTGVVEARIWEKADLFSSLFQEGDIVEVVGTAGSYRNQIQVTLTDLKISKEVPDPGLFIESAAGDVVLMTSSLRKILNEIRESRLKTLIHRFLSDRPFMAQFKRAPAAKSFHHNYLGGLLEHTLSVCKMSQAAVHHYPELDRDLLLAGAFLHDIGKVREYRFDYRIDYTDEGRLLGHLVLGVGMLEEKLAEMDHFPADLSLKLKHLILSHHGQYEFGSPKRPKFLEAFALHLIDDLDAKINGLRRFMERDRQEGTWTEFNRMFERYLLKGELLPEEGERTSESRIEERQTPLFSS